MAVAELGRNPVLPPQEVPEPLKILPDNQVEQVLVETGPASRIHPAETPIGQWFEDFAGTRKISLAKCFARLGMTRASRKVRDSFGFDTLMRILHDGPESLNLSTFETERLERAIARTIQDKVEAGHTFQDNAYNRGKAIKKTQRSLEELHYKTFNGREAAKELGVQTETIYLHRRGHGWPLLLSREQVEVLRGEIRRAKPRTPEGKLEEGQPKVESGTNTSRTPEEQQFWRERILRERVTRDDDGPEDYQQVDLGSALLALYSRALSFFQSTGMSDNQVIEIAKSITAKALPYLRGEEGEFEDFGSFKVKAFSKMLLFAGIALHRSGKVGQEKIIGKRLAIARERPRTTIRTGFTRSDLQKADNQHEQRIIELRLAGWEFPQISTLLGTNVATLRSQAKVLEKRLHPGKKKG